MDTTRRPQPLAKTQFLKKPREFQRVYRQGLRLKGEQFSLIYHPNMGIGNRLGISVHGIKKAVQRNRIKRIIREFFRLNRNFIPPSVDVIFAIRKGFKADRLQDFENMVWPLVKDISYDF